MPSTVYFADMRAGHRENLFVSLITQVTPS